MWYRVQTWCPTGYFHNNTYHSAYGTYKAEVVENDPIREVYWYFKKPGDTSSQQVKHDEVNGGKTSSWSYTLGSTSGTYVVDVMIYFANGRATLNHTRRFYID